MTAAASTDYGPIAFAVDPFFGFAGGVYDFVIDAAHDTAYFTYSLVDAFFSDPPTAPINYIVKVNSLADPGAGYSVVTIVGSDDPDGPGGNPDNHFPESEGVAARHRHRCRRAGALFRHPAASAPDGTAGIFKLDLATGIYTEIWEQPSNSAHNTPQPFPTTLLEDIEVDTIGGVYYVTTFASSDVATRSMTARRPTRPVRAIFIGDLDDVATAPAEFVNAFEPTANGAPLGMEINYSAERVGLTSSGVAYTEQGAGDRRGRRRPVVSDPDQTSDQGSDSRDHRRLRRRRYARPLRPRRGHRAAATTRLTGRADAHRQRQLRRLPGGARFGHLQRDGRQSRPITAPIRPARSRFTVVRRPDEQRSRRPPSVTVAGRQRRAGQHDRRPGRAAARRTRRWRSPACRSATSTRSGDRRRPGDALGDARHDLRCHRRPRRHHRRRR